MSNDTLQEVYDRGWVNCAVWANRTDLITDCDSAAYEKDRSEALAKPMPPIPMVLHCPQCHTQHIDAPEEHDEQREHGLVSVADWTNPPHRSHLCAACGCVWRPADVCTTGVAAISTRGKDDTWPL